MLASVMIAIIVVQCLNMAKDPKWTDFPNSCPDTDQYCLRIASSNSKNQDDILAENKGFSFNLHNGEIAFKDTIL
jgi:hypothetical protein